MDQHPKGAISARITEVTNRPPVTHALILAFKGSELTQEVEKIAQVMRTKLRWNTYIYWIQGLNSRTAQVGLENTGFALHARIVGVQEKVVICYKGHSCKPRQWKEGNEPEYSMEVWLE